MNVKLEKPLSESFACWWQTTALVTNDEKKDFAIERSVYLKTIPAKHPNRDSLQFNVDQSRMD